nr:PREDICTED: growth/differentiation factor 2 [Lepisosteus oculatus]
MAKIRIAVQLFWLTRVCCLLWTGTGKLQLKFRISAAKIVAPQCAASHFNHSETELIINPNLELEATMNCLFPLWISLMVLTGPCRCKPLNGVIKMRETEMQFQISKQDSSEDPSEDLNLGGLLENVKDEFLRLLNLSGVPHEHSRTDPPHFMMELYNRYAMDKSSTPRSDVIRSFNIQDVSHSKRNSSETQHLLRFNLSIPSHEEITMAELRLFTSLDHSAMNHNFMQATIKVYDVEYHEDQPVLHFLSAKSTEGKDPTWEVFEVTDAIKRWVKSGQTTNTLGVRVERRDTGAFEGGGIDISISVKNNSSAVLIVFSDDRTSDKTKDTDELKDMIAHEEESFVLSEQNNKSTSSVRDQPRRKRHAKDNYCRRTSLRVDFKEIGWDSWIVAPKVYDAFECKGLCSYPLTDDVTPSKHAIIQTLVNLNNPNKAEKACCVPTKLDPITLMYYESGIFTVKHFYEGMKVAECGCR